MAGAVAHLIRYRFNITSSTFLLQRGGLYGALKILSPIRLRDTGDVQYSPSTNSHNMSSNNASLDAASNDRKARLAKLAALKRKQPEADSQDPGAENDEPSEASEETLKFLSGRNYDAETRGPKLGFEEGPQEGKVTVETQAAEIAERVKEQAQQDADADQPIDLFKLQPKKPNWDLRRDLDEKLKTLNVRTENAIARLVRQRVEGAQRAAKERGATSNGGQGEEVGIEGQALVEGIHMREQEEKGEDDI